MTNFTKTERWKIREALLKEGERLFSEHGLKKVAVEDVAHAAGISKGAFYGFFANKEQLYMEAAEIQKMRLRLEAEAFLNRNRRLPPQELAGRLIGWMLAQADFYPLLRPDGETRRRLNSRLPPSVAGAHLRGDEEGLRRLERYGIRFTCNIEVAARVVRWLAAALPEWEEPDGELRRAAAEQIITGIAEKLVEG
ncbi:MAG TPA: TetR/AcrR family transcriptional regulator [Firmicutes bacterium]|nr:TetR/AcrR family transcriptional regulator [Bacillota bacterium]